MPTDVKAFDRRDLVSDWRPVRRVVIVFALLLVLPMSVAHAEELPPGGTFIDDDGSVFEPSIEAIYAEGITVGCSDRAQFCPDRGVTRGEMAAFLSRALKLPRASMDYFDDDNSSIFNDDINKIAEVGITKGCNPPANDRFCPTNVLTRGEMAAFLVRAFELDPASQPDHFVDDDDSIFEAQIDSLAEARVTFGCNPPANDNYCPRDRVSRGAMAAFLTRAIPLETITPPQRPPTHLVSRYTTYHACCQERVHNIHVIANQLDGWIVLPGETFDLNAVTGPRTRSKGYIEAPILVGGETEMGVAGGTSQFGTTIYNAFFWGGYDEITHKPHSIYISRYPVGIEATLGRWDPLNVVFTNDTVNPIYIDTSYTSTSITVSLYANNGGRTFVGSWRGGPHHSIWNQGGPDARRVTAEVSGSPPGWVKIVRTIAGPDGTASETWWWHYND